MSAPEWEGATDCYLSLPALSSLEIKKQLNKITLLLYTEMCGIKGTHIYKHEEEGDVCKAPLLTLSLQCFPLNLKQIFRVKSPEQAEEQPKKSSQEPNHYTTAPLEGAEGEMAMASRFRRTVKKPKTSCNGFMSHPG